MQSQLYVQILFVLFVQVLASCKFALPVQDPVGELEASRGQSVSLQELEDFLNADRFIFYASKQAARLRRAGFEPEAKALESIDRGLALTILSKTGQRARSAFNYDVIISQYLRSLSVPMQATETDIAWGYDFYKKKLDEGFSLDLKDPATLAAKDFYASASTINEDVKASHPKFMTFGAENYIADRMTRAIFWFANDRNIPIRFYLGAESEFRKRVENSVILGEVKTLARNYNKIYLVASENQIHIAISNITGTDRLHHLMLHASLIGKGAGQKKTAPLEVVGDPATYTDESAKILTEKYSRLPRADFVIIGQKSVAEGMFQALAQFRDLQNVLSSEPEKLNADEQKLIRAFEVKIAGADYSVLRAQSAQIAKIAERLQIPSSKTSAFEMEFDSHTLSDMHIKDQSGGTKIIRLISNVWGDEIVPIARALKNTGHSNVFYIGTAGSLNASKYKVGELFIPSIASLEGSENIPINDSTNVESVQKGGAVLQVRSPFDETNKWYENIRTRAEAVEVETYHLARELGKNVKIMLLISDVVKSEETLDEVNYRKRENALVTSLKYVFRAIAPHSVRPAISPADVRSTLDNREALVNQAAGARDPAYRYHLLQLMRKRQLEDAQSLEVLMQESPAFSTQVLEKRLLEAGDALEGILDHHDLDLAKIKIYASNNVRDGTYNPRTDRLSMFLLVKDLSMRDRLSSMLKDSSSPKHIDFQVVATAPADSIANEVSTSPSLTADFLVKYYAKNAQTNAGVISSEGRTGRIKFAYSYDPRSDKLKAPNRCKELSQLIKKNYQEKSGVVYEQR